MERCVRRCCRCMLKRMNSRMKKGADILLIASQSQSDEEDQLGCIFALNESYVIIVFQL